MNDRISKTLFAGVILAAAAFLFQPARVSAGSMEGLRAQNPLAGFDLKTAALDIPAAAAPVPDAAYKAAASALPNFAKVSDALYRSGQPTYAGMAQIEAAGIKSILKLNDNTPSESNWAQQDGIGFNYMLMPTKQSPSYDQIDQALAFINDPANQPVLVHCHLGHDRTGAVVAAYRVTVQGWSVDKAAAEATQMGYSDPYFQEISTYLQGYVQHLQQRSVDSTATRAPMAVPNWSVTPGNLCTPGDPNFKEYRYTEHIAYCNRNVTLQMKQQVAAEYNVPQSDWSSYEFDHLIPLCIGGDSSVDNLWPQPRGMNGGSDDKDKLENQLYKEMAAGTITQKAAVQQIYDWFQGYAARHPELPAQLRTKLSTLGN